MGIADFVYRLKPQSGDASPHNEIGAGEVLAGGTITLVDRGGGDWAWQFAAGQASAVIPQHAVNGTANNTGVTVAVTFKITTYPATNFAAIVAFSPDTTAVNGVHFDRESAGNLRTRFNTTLSFSLGAIGTTERTLVLRIETSTVNASDFMRAWLNQVGRVGTAADASSSGTNVSGTHALDTLLVNATDSCVIQIKDLVVWPEQLSDADCAALADDLRGQLDDITAPTITGPGSATGGTSSISIAENTAAVFTFLADEAVTWDLNGGADVALFSINSSTGALTFIAPPDFEAPGDADTDNAYVVGVRATDASSNATTQTCTVTVTDVPIPTAPTIGTTTSITSSGAIINWTDNSSNETGFEVEIETPSGAANWADATGGANPTAPNATNLGINSLAGGTEYRPRVRAKGAEGDSAWSTGTAFTTSSGGSSALPLILTLHS